MSERFLGAFQQTVLLALLRIGNDASLLEIAAEIERRTERRVSRGGLHTTLVRLQDKGYLRPRVGPASEFGGTIRTAEVTARGVAALRESRQALLNLWEGLDPILRDAADAPGPTPAVAASTGT